MRRLFDLFVMCGLIAVFCAVAAGQACAQQPSRAGPDAPEMPALAPPVNHESGIISEVLTVQDAGYRQVGYVVRWRDSQIFVSGTPSEPHRVGDNLDFVVYRTVTGGRKKLRFAAHQSRSDTSGERDESERDESERDESESSHASITSGSAPVDNTFVAENDGYRFAAYTVMWHGMRVVVVDPVQREDYKIGDRINFGVLRSGAGDDRVLAFALSD